MHITVSRCIIFFSDSYNYYMQSLYLCLSGLCFHIAHCFLIPVSVLFLSPVWVKNVSIFRVALPIRLHCQVFARYVLEHFRYRPELQEKTQTLWLACSAPRAGAETRPHKGDELVGLIRLDKRWFAQICRGPHCASRSAHGGDVAGRAVTSQSSLILSSHPAEIPVPLLPQRGGRGDRPNSFQFSMEKTCKKQCNAGLHWPLFPWNYTGQTFSQPPSEALWRWDFFTTWHI